METILNVNLGKPWLFNPKLNVFVKLINHHLHGSSTTAGWVCVTSMSVHDSPWPSTALRKIIWDSRVGFSILQWASATLEWASMAHRKLLWLQNDLFGLRMSMYSMVFLSARPSFRNSTMRLQGSKLNLHCYRMSFYCSKIASPVPEWDLKNLEWTSILQTINTDSRGVHHIGPTVFFWQIAQKNMKF